jgi:hypothetical protein
MAAFEVLAQTFSDLLLVPRPRSDSWNGCSDCAYERLCPDVSSWLHRWAAFSKHAQPHDEFIPRKPPTRIILAFLGRIPQSYVDLVKPILDAEPPGQCETPSAGSTSSEDANSCLTGDLTANFSMPARSGSPVGRQNRPLGHPSMLLEQTMALEIFAHWLVLLLLLGDSWCFEGVALQELTRVIAAVKGSHTLLRSQLPDAAAQGRYDLATDHDWWPESMCRIATELESLGKYSCVPRSSAHHFDYLMSDAFARGSNPI